MRQRLLEYRRSVPGGWAQIRRITSQATEVGPDKQGRILVPAWLQEAADLKGSVMVIGALDRIEIWNPSVLAKAESGRDDDFSELAPKIFG